MIYSTYNVWYSNKSSFYSDIIISVYAYVYYKIQLVLSYVLYVQDSDISCILKGRGTYNVMLYKLTEK